MEKKGTILGVDLGGTKTALGLYDFATLKRLEEKILPTNAERGYAAVAKNLVEEIRAMKTDDTIAIGLGVPGLIDAKSGRILTMPNIPGSENTDIKSEIETHTGLKVNLENDASCFAYAEAKLGAGKGRAIVIGITLGTGVGGGIVIDGKLFRGEHGYAGELGHMLLKPGDPPFDTRNLRGEVEQFLSGTALRNRCPKAKTPRDYLEGDACAGLRGQMIREIAWLVSSLTHSIDPSIIVFGGSVGRALKPHLNELRDVLKKWLLTGYPLPEVTCGILDDSARRGACLLARESLKQA